MAKYMRPAKARRKFLKRLYGIVKKEIDYLDVLQIFDIGAPPDEYDLETKDICKRLMNNMPDSQDGIIKVIQDVFMEWMDILVRKDKLLTIAAQIYAISVKDGT